MKITHCIPWSGVIAGMFFLAFGLAVQYGAAVILGVAFLAITFSVTMERVHEAKAQEAKAQGGKR